MNISGGETKARRGGGYISPPGDPSTRQRHAKMGIFFKKIRQKCVSEATNKRQRDVGKPHAKVARGARCGHKKAQRGTKRKVDLAVIDVMAGSP